MSEGFVEKVQTPWLRVVGNSWAAAREWGAGGSSRGTFVLREASWARHRATGILPRG